ncbi:ARM repeat-containing protein [Coniochaeta ligniaria NRRL 30616]|uniref:ARM repeat-containing protein n=1 Tax=Coniochaeta ligniaria NRRL 30616 TaxID=1408157 RepID=A0A1J7JC03_9PEZI|nr:ARM repeat-containing protein [Coniochaeta ligniaria NRRL 30616]
MDDFFRSQQTPRGDSQLNTAAFVSPPRNGPQLPRRFTTDSGRVPTLSSLAAVQRVPESQDVAVTATYHKVQLLEKKRLEYEKLREQKRRFEAEMHKLDAQQRQEERELAALTDDLGRFGGHQSEPTTPPEYRETSSGFPTMFSKPNRYSTSSLTSPQGGLYNRPARSGSQLASPQSGIIQNRFAFDDQLPSRSVPGSRRNSDEDEKEEAVRQDPTSHRSTNATNRYSMPVTRSRSYIADLNLDSGLDGNNTTGFLFGDEDTSHGETKAYQQANNADNFPTLVRNAGYPSMLSASSTALDLAQASSTASEAVSTSNGWGSINRHRTQQSLSTITSSQLPTTSAIGSGPASEVSTIGSRPSSIRHSLDLNNYQVSSPGASDTTTTASIVSPPTNHINIMATPPKLQQSYSANDVPTVKNGNGTSNMSSNANNHAQQHFHNHNASLGRIPAGAVPNRHSRELSGDNNMAANRDVSAYASIGSTLHANAPAFGPVATNNYQLGAANVASVPAQYPYYNGASAYNGVPNNTTGNNYTTSMLSMSMQGLNLNGNNGQPMYSAHGYGGYNQMYNPVTRVVPQDSQARVIQNRRQMDNEAMSRFHNLPLEAVGGQIYSLCKDQHGCRYLQKQLENRIPEQIHMIWLETNLHVIELMTDPFGNYLCQKLLEYCNDEERTVLIQNAAQDMIRIALNQHGTRALQKMIEFITSAQQVDIIVNALRYRVVDLIQDLNGNHVIQKCLNKLSSRDAQFIFDAVGNNCVDVGTHRHGCCVLQRCIDHASGDQKDWLIGKITENAVALVQDPFGNYVVQYIIDLNDPKYTEPIVIQFRGRISQLSRHKFSSNVIEKCLRCSNDASKDLIAEELLSPGEMDRLLRDSFANYVVQTALEYATPFMKHRLVENIRPILPGIRSTPYGRRIQAKVQAYDNRNGTGTSVNGHASGPTSAHTSGQVTPADPTQGQIPIRPQHNRGLSNGATIIGTPAFTNALNGVPNRGAAPIFSSGLPVAPPQPQRAQQYASSFALPGPPGSGAQGNGSSGEGSDQPQWL